MFVVLLKFSDNKGKASQLMEGHKEWIKRNFDDGVFLLVGSLQPNLGGGDCGPQYVTAGPAKQSE